MDTILNLQSKGQGDWKNFAKILDGLQDTTSSVLPTVVERALES